MRAERSLPEAGGLQNGPFLPSLPAKRRRELLLHVKRRSFDPGEELFREDDPADGVFFLVAGTVRLTRRAFDRTMVVGDEHAPVTLATIGLFDGGSNSITAVARCPCDVYVLQRTEFERLCAGNPAYGAWLLSLFSMRIRRMIALMDVLALASVRQRLARLILEMVQEDAGAEVRLPLTQEEIAVRLGTVREVVFRNLKQLQNDGIIHFHRGFVAIDNLPRLQAAAQPQTA